MIALLVFLLAGAPASADLPERTALRQGLRASWDTDVRSWGEYAFRRHVLRRSFDASGNVTFERQMLFQVTPEGDRFDELLLQIDGREPTPKEVAYHRRKQRFTNHYSQAEDLALDNPLGEDLLLLPLIESQEHELIGEEVVDGTPCYRTRFDARPEPKGGSLNERISTALEGTACFSIDGIHLVVFEMRTVRTIKAKGVRLRRLEMRIAGHAVGEAWLPRSLELRSDVNAWGKKLRKLNRYDYSSFERVP